jgi:hypothetical protein
MKEDNMSLNRNDLLQKMSSSVGKEDPIVFFKEMINVFTLLFDRIDELETNIHNTKTYAALAIQWDPRVASNLLSKQIQVLRENKEIYFNQLSNFKIAYTEDKVTQDYKTFCQFWMDNLGCHPFLDYTA